jgi:hypothetical protein
MVPSSRSRTISLISAGILAALSLTAAKGQEKATAATACEIAIAQLNSSRGDLREMQKNIARSGISKISPSVEIELSPDIKVSGEQARELAGAILEIQKSQVEIDEETVDKKCPSPIAISQLPALSTLHS